MKKSLGLNCAAWLVPALAALAMTGCGGDGQGSDSGSDDGGPDVVITLDTGNDAEPDTPLDTHIDASQDIGEDLPGQDIPAEIPEDLEPPVVAATYPTNEETGVPLDFVIRVTFSEDMREITLNKNYVKLYDIYDQDIKGEITYDAVSFTMTFTPDPGAEIFGLTPYRFWISNQVQDRAGNELGTEYQFRFSTEGPVQMDGYLDIAAKYAPRLYQSTEQSSAQWDYPTLSNFDGDWVADNNVGAFSSLTSVPVWVYYDVIETYTHYFIRYHYFYVRHEDTSKTYGNEVAGTMVVVRKNPETPIAVETYFGTGAFEDIRSFVTTESGLVVDDGDGDYNDGDRKNYNVNWVFPQDQLFPGGHFQNYLTKKSHESCAWIQTNVEDGLDFKCQLTVASKPTLKILHFAYKDGKAESVSSPFPYSNAEGTDIGYGLKLAIDDWWVRRDRTGENQLFSATIDYDAPDGMVGEGLILPGSFRSSPDGSQAGGKSPWRWTWEPAVAGAYNYYTEFTEGTFYLHPAYYFARRHRLTTTTDATGFSAAYCYNPYLRIDKRGQTADCRSLD